MPCCVEREPGICIPSLLVSMSCVDTFLPFIISFDPRFPIILIISDDQSPWLKLFPPSHTTADSMALSPFVFPPVSCLVTPCSNCSLSLTRAFQNPDDAISVSPFLNICLQSTTISLNPLTNSIHLPPSVSGFSSQDYVSRAVLPFD
jgi:hypothetical protein